VFLLAPPPGRAFATLEFKSDYEQIARAGGSLLASAVGTGEAEEYRTIYGLAWPREDFGRDTVTGRADVPEGGGVVLLNTHQWPGHYRLHSIRVEATFRPFKPGGFRHAAGRRHAGGQRQAVGPAVDRELRHRAGGV
jgi:hypothetical protein